MAAKSPEYGKPRVRGGRARSGRWRRRSRRRSSRRRRPRPANGRSGRADRGRPRRGGSRTRTGTAPGRTRGDSADVLERVRREPQLGRRLLGRGPVERRPGGARSAARSTPAWSSRRSIDGTQPAPISITPPRSVGWRSSTPSSTSTDTNRSAGWYTTMKSLDPMTSAPVICSAGGRPSSIHSAPMRQRPAADVQHERDAALGQPGPERVVVGDGRAPGRRARGPGSRSRAARGRARRRARPGPVRGRRGRRCRRRAAGRRRRRTRPSPGCGPGTRRSAASGSAIVEQRRAERRVDDLVLEAEQVEGLAPLVGDRRRRARRATSGPADQLVAEGDELGALLGRVPAGVEVEAGAPPPVSVGHPVAQRRDRRDRRGTPAISIRWLSASITRRVPT